MLSFHIIYSEAETFTVLSEFAHFKCTVVPRAHPMLDCSYKSPLRSVGFAALRPGRKKNNAYVFLGREVNSEMFLFLFNLGIKFILQNSSNSISSETFYNSQLPLLCLYSSVSSIQQVFTEHLFARHRPLFSGYRFGKGHIS